ncbi:hypothetical protein [Pseudoduganella violaceinigra]|uniref:hypothetical protein n=1 Tax=Pseudoduganella violaceinigra TaxID=246602 RepID=UPI000486D498|nr:hypothetical protein [Pseudoduganella violaceinigra]
MKIFHTALPALTVTFAAHAQESDQAALKAAEERGRRIYIHDHASAIVSDAAVPLLIPSARAHVRGHITEDRMAACSAPSRSMKSRKH